MIVDAKIHSAILRLAPDAVKAAVLRPRIVIGERALIVERIEKEFRAFERPRSLQHLNGGRNGLFSSGHGIERSAVPEVIHDQAILLQQCQDLLDRFAHYGFGQHFHAPVARILHIGEGRMPLFFGPDHSAGRLLLGRLLARRRCLQRVRY